MSSSGVPFGLYKPPTISVFRQRCFPSSELTAADKLGEVAVASVERSVMGDSAAADVPTRGVEAAFLSPRGSLVGHGGTRVIGSMSAGLGASVLFAMLSRDAT